MLERRRTSEQLDRTRRRAEITLSFLHVQARNRRRGGAERPGERSLLGVVVGGNTIAVQAHQIGRDLRLLQDAVDHARQPLAQRRWVLGPAQAAVAGGRREARQRAVHARAARERVLGLLEDEETASLAGDEPAPTVVGSDHARAPVRREE